MLRRIFLSLVGAIVLFVWGFAGHVIIRIYDPVYHGFLDEAEVVTVLENNAPMAGIYYLPFRPARDDRPSQAEAFVNYVPAGERAEFSAMAVRGLGINAITVFLVLTLFANLRWNAYWTGVGRFALAGLAISFSAHAYYWNWFDFPSVFLALSVTDAVVGWTLAGLVLSKMMKSEFEKHHT